jgi:hypothetical protein
MIGAKEALHHGIVVTVAHATHADLNTEGSLRTADSRHWYIGSHDQSDTANRLEPLDEPGPSAGHA